MTVSAVRSIHTAIQPYHRSPIIHRFPSQPIPTANNHQSQTESPRKNVHCPTLSVRFSGSMGRFPENLTLTALHGHKRPQRSNDATAPPSISIGCQKSGRKCKNPAAERGVRPGGTSTVDQGTMIFGRGVPHEVRTVAMIRGKQSYAPRRFAECMSTSDTLVSLILQRNQLISA